MSLAAASTPPRWKPRQPLGRHGTHLFVIGGTAVLALVLLALSAVVAYARRGQIASLARFL